MKISVSAIKSFASILIIVIIVVVGFFAIIKKSSNDSEVLGSDTSVVSIINDKQIIHLTAKAGYSPKVIEAKAGIESTLIVTTKNTFDCSSAISIPTLGYRKILPATGTTEIPITPQSIGTVIKGTCSMGMYGFEIRFV